MAMPALAELERGYENVHVTYADVPGGGSIRYLSAEPRLVAALHRWFGAQSWHRRRARHAQAH